MRRLGVITDITYSGHLLVEADFAPQIGEIVLDSRKRKLGEVVRVFGPTKAPFVTIKPSEKKTSFDLVGKELFLG
ncbi:MAG: H/ACA ribonucleoprotein complex subunit GAR1 [Thermoplasmata archaeon]